MSDQESQNNKIDITATSNSQNDYFDFMLRKEQMELFGVSAADQKTFLGMSEMQRLEMEILKKLNSTYTDSDPRLLQIYSYFGTRSKAQIAKKLAEKKYHKMIANQINNELIDDAEFKSAIQARSASMGIDITKSNNLIKSAYGL